MKKNILISLGVLVVLLGVLSIGNLDYTISKALINEQSIWAEFFNLFGELPAILGLLIGSALLFGSRNKAKKSSNIMGWILGILFITLFSVAIVLMPLNYAFEHHENGIPTIALVLGLLLSIGISVCTIILSNKHQEKCVTYKNTGILFIGLVLAEIIAINVLKGIWARPRMRSIDDISEFKRWFEISGWTNDNEFKSFPSGHTANALASIAYILLVPMTKRVSKKHVVVFTIIWGCLVALSRVVLGAHFLSDVIIGGYVTVFIFLGLNHLFIKKEWINQQ